MLTPTTLPLGPLFASGLAALAALAAALNAQAPAFSDRTAEVGLSFTPVTAGFASAIQAGGGLAGDFDNDGWQDVYIFGGSGMKDRLYMNNANGTFTDEAASWGVDLMHKGKGPTAGDFNGDGWLDIFVSSAGPPGGTQGQAGAHLLWRNNGDGTMTNVAAAAGVNFTAAGTGDGWGACWGDYDLDGDLDLFVGGWSLNNQGNRLFRNDGDETFTDVTNLIGLWAATPSSTYVCSPVFADMDGDQYPELLLASDFGSMRYFSNDGDGTFTDVSVAAQINDAENGMGQVVRDFDRDGKRDWYVTSIYAPQVNWTGNKLHLNASSGPGNHVFAEVGVAAGVVDGAWGWGTIGVDVNHDGWLDIGETNGWNKTGQWAGKPSYLWIQQVGGTYVDMAASSGLVHTGDGRGMFHFDSDNDGDQDVVILSYNEPVRFFRNDLIDATEGTGADVHWLRVFLDTSNRPDLAPQGYGSEVRVTIGATTWLGNIDGGDNFLSQNELSAHFGLATATLVDELRVTWNDDSETVLTNVAVDQTLTIQSPDGSPWEDLGFALGGTNGEPTLTPEGTLLAGEDLTLTLSGALENTTAYLIASAFAINAPFKGGTLVPNPTPPGVVVPLGTGPAGGVAVTASWPPGLPRGIEFYVQSWIVDAGGPNGFAASNAVLGVTP